MAWMLLGIAIIFEVIGTIALKMSNGLTAILPGVIVFGGYAASFLALAKSLQWLDVGVAYAIWAGTGTALISIVSVSLFNETLTNPKIISIMLIISGVIGLHLFQDSTTS